MFDIGWTEILIIAVVAIIVVGPKDLPRMLRSLGRYAGQLKRTAGEFRSQFDDAVRESELDDLRNTLSDVSDLNPVNQIRDSVTESMAPLKETADDIKGSIEAPQAAFEGEAEEKSVEEKKTAAKAKSKSKPKPKTKPKAEASADKSGGEG
jgi:sec-independent protein translocase protein TatB